MIYILRVNGINYYNYVKQSTNHSLRNKISCSNQIKHNTINCKMTLSHVHFTLTTKRNQLLQKSTIPSLIIKFSKISGVQNF